MPGSIPVIAALQVFIDLRGATDIVVTNQGSARTWPKLARHALDFHYNPSTMGGAVPLALGLALAQPDRRVICVTGDGALLMNLGSLVTVAGAGATNLSVVVLDNRRYEVTGGQKTPAANTVLDWAGLARGAGLVTVHAFHDLSAWQSQAAEVLVQPGPRLISLSVDRAPSDYLRAATPPIAGQLADFRRALAKSA